jgi:hypothetical protein
MSLRLRCLIEGEDIVFPVNAVFDDEVSDLKDKIKKKCAVTLEGVDAHHLELWKVSAIDDSICEMTLLFLAQGTRLHRRQAKQHSHSAYQAPGLFKFYRQIRTRGQRL